MKNKEKIIPALLELKSRTKNCKPLEQALLSNIKGSDFDNWLDLSNSLSYLLCLSKMYEKGSIKAIDKVLANDFIIESRSDIDDVMNDIVQVCEQYFNKKLLDFFDIENSRHNRSLLTNVLICDEGETKAELIALIKSKI